MADKDFRAIIKAQLDTSDIPNQIRTHIENQTITFNNVSFNRNNLINQIQSVLDNYQFRINLGANNLFNNGFLQQMRQSGSNAGQQFASSFNRAINGIDLHNGGIGHVNGMLQQLGFDRNSLRTITENLGNMKLQIDSIRTTMLSSGNIRLTVTGQDELLRSVQIVRDFDKETGNIINTSKSFIQNFAQQEAQIQRNTSAVMKYGDRLAAIQTRFTGDESKSRLFNEVHINEFNAALQNVYNTITLLETATAEETTVLKANIDSQINAVTLLAQSFHNVEMAERSDETQLQKNTAAVTGYLSKLESIQAKYNSDSNKPIINPSNLSQVNVALDKVLNQIILLENASSSEAVTIKANIDSEINSLNLLVQSLQRVESEEKSNEQQLIKNEAEIAKYKSTIEKLSYDAFNANATKPIKNSENINQLQSAFIQASLSVEQLRQADSTTFTEMKSNVDSTINGLKLLIISLQDAEYAASQLRAKPVNVVRDKQLGLLKAFVADIQKAGISLEQFTRVDIAGLETMLRGVTNADGLKQYLNMLSVAKAEFKGLKQEAAQFASAADVNILKGKMETWLNKNTKAAGTYGNTIRNLIAELDALAAEGKVPETEIQRIRDAFKEVDAAASAAGMKGRSFFQSIVGAAKSLTRYFGVSTFIYRTFAAVKEGITNIVDLDTALVDLRKTTDATEAELKEFYYTANDTAKQLGVTTKEVISAAAEWSRLGYSIKDAETMAQTSSIFASISPGVDIEKATDGLVSAMKAFNIEADDALDGVASKINAIGNSQAVSNENIVDFLTRSSSAMKEANNTLEETIALGTAA